MIGGDFTPGGIATWLGKGDGTLHDLHTIPRSTCPRRCLEAADTNAMAT